MKTKTLTAICALILAMTLISCAKQTQIANPASVYCEQQGYTLELRNSTGYCIFKDGSECEEWSYYRRECFPKNMSDKEKAIEDCMKLCEQQTKQLGSECLSNEIIPDWVCDVAHEPRQPQDNQPENQCLAYRKAEAKHFVEITPDCEFIRAI